MIKKLFLAVFAIVICLCLSGCSIDVSSVEGLMRPPKLSGENSLLQEAFEKYLNLSKNTIMKTPISGENRSSFLYYDLDNNGVKEAFAFYSDVSVDENACAAIFKFVNNEWQLVSNIKGSGEDIFEVDFADINGDGCLELVICWTYLKTGESDNTASFTNSGERIMSVYSYNGNSTTLITTQPFSKMLVGDFNGDKSDEILLVSVDLSEKSKRTIGRILGFNSNYDIVRSYDLILTSMIDVLNIDKDTVTVEGEKHTRIFVDGGISETAVITDVVDISHSDFEITLPLYETNISEKPLTIRDVSTLSADIDGDGEIEIPTVENLPYSSVINNESSRNLSLTIWSKVENGELITEYKCLMNSLNGYMFIFPEEWTNSITAVYNSTNATLRFYEVNESGTLGDEVFSIRSFSEIKWKENNYDYNRLASSGAIVFGYTVSENSEIITVDDITENFVILN